MAPSRYTLGQFLFGQHSLQLEYFADPEGEFRKHFEMDEAKDTPEPPLYGALWPSAEALAQFLWQEWDTLKPETVLEIGCGLALPSLVCALRQARVIAMDHHPDVFPLLQKNCQRNGLSIDRCIVGSFADHHLDLGRFQLLLASDILYEPTLYPDLANFLKRHMAPGARLLVADPGRYAVPQFVQLMTQQLSHQLVRRRIDGHQHPIEIHCFEQQA